MPSYVTEKLSLYKNKEILVTTLVIFICLILSVVFPASNTFQSISRNLFLLVFLPTLYIKLVLKSDLREWGWNMENKKEGFALATAALFSGLLIFYFLFRFTGFSSHYILPVLIKNNIFMFLIYELIFLNIFLFAQEFFFKVFVLFSFSQFSYWAIVIQSGIYLLLFLLSGAFSWKISPFIFISIVGGYITYKTNSFFYSYIFGLLFIIILDAGIIYLVK